MPYIGIGTLDRRLRDAVDMGGTQQLHVLRLGDLTLLERTGSGRRWNISIRYLPEALRTPPR
jgi:hypothetical protein